MRTFTADSGYPRLERLHDAQFLGNFTTLWKRLNGYGIPLLSPVIFSLKSTFSEK